MEAANRMHARKENATRQRSLLDEQLLRTIPLVNEGNAISEELSKGCRFAVKLQVVPSASRAGAAVIIFACVLLSREYSIGKIWNVVV